MEKKELQKKKDKERVLETKKMLLDDLKNEEEQKKLGEGKLFQAFRSLSLFWYFSCVAYNYPDVM